MKTRELIRLLQEADPSGEIEVCVDNKDILFVQRMPAYYDGCLEVLIRDPKLTSCYNVVGAKVFARGAKIRIVPHSIEDMLLDKSEAAVDLGDLGSFNNEWQTYLAKWREVGRSVSDPDRLSVDEEEPNR